MSQAPRDSRARAAGGVPTTAQPNAREKPRRIAGAILGAIVGLGFGLTGQLVNRIALPGIPLHQPPLGPAGNVLLNAFTGGFLGLVAAWPRSAAVGVVLAAAIGAAAYVANAMLLLQGTLPPSTLFIAGATLAIPASWFVIPAVALLRFGADRQAESYLARGALLRRVRLPLVLTLLALAAGWFELLDPGARQELTRTHAMLQEAARVTSQADLPQPLLDSDVARFSLGGLGRYTLEWTDTDLDRFISLRPPGNYGDQAAVIARGPTGYTLVCIYTSPKAEPSCGDTWQSGRPIQENF